MKRVVAEGEYVVAHYHMTHPDHEHGVAVVDIWRLEDGLIVEHWTSYSRQCPNRRPCRTGCSSQTLRVSGPGDPLTPSRQLQPDVEPQPSQT